MVGVLLIVGCGLAAAFSSDAPIPSDIDIIPPDSSLPDTVKALSGKWFGLFGNRWDCLLFVEKIGENHIDVVVS